MKRVFAMVWLSFVAAAGAAAPRPGVVLLIENRSAQPDAASEVQTSLSTLLQSKGYDVITGDEVNDFLEASGSPHLEALPPRTVDRLLLRFHADEALAVTISFFLEGQRRERGPVARPAVGLTARLLGAGGVEVWRGSLGGVADDGGFGKNAADAVRRMAATTCDRLLWSLPKAARTAAREAPPREGRPRFPLLIHRHPPALAP